VPAQFLTTDDALQFAWPTLAELNEEIMSELGFDLGAGANAGDSVVHLPGLCTGPPPAPPTCPNPFAIPSASIIAKQIIDSDDKYFSSRGRLDLVFANGAWFVSP